MANRKYLKSLVALAICFSMALLPVMQTVSAQPISASEAAQQQLNAIMPSVNALNLEISSNLNTYAQQLSTNVAFTTTPAMDSVTPASQGATYFSIGVGGTSLYDGVITLGSVTGGIWSANGTFLYVYEAWIDPSSLQIVNVTVYLYSSLEPSAPPSLSASNVYTIGEPNASVLQATIGSSTAQVTPLASGCGYYGNWSGYCVEGPSNSETYIAEAYMQTNVIFPNTGNYGYYSYMGVASWDGLAEL